MKNHTLISAAIFSLFTTTINAQIEGKLKGVIIDSDSTKSEGVSVYLDKTDFYTISDRNGYFEIRNIPAGDYDVIAVALNISPVSKRISIYDRKVTEVNFTLKEKINELGEIIVSGTRVLKGIERMNEVEDMGIYSGKKTEVIGISKFDANLTTNNSRQIFSKTPGISVWENDGSGIQIGVACRGLSPNRSWEFNVRQNGIDITPDAFGYPEAYYNPPMEALEKIQIVRGAATLQYGPQFGGLLNYVIKKPDPSKALVYETNNTFGSYGLFSSFNGIGGTYKKISYYAYFQHRNANGWRDNSNYSINNGYGSLTYQPTKLLKLGAEFSYTNYLSQQAGGLTDLQLKENAQQSMRSRNWFSTPWIIPSINAEYTFTDNSKVSFKTWKVLGERNSIGFVKPITIKDTIGTNYNYSNRQIDKDDYNTFGAELRYLQEYNILNQKQALSSGIRYYKARTIRQQKGKGDTGVNYNLILNDSTFPTELNYNTSNYAFFVENLFRLNNKLSITPGLRYEIIGTSAEGRIGYNADNSPKNINRQEAQRNVVLFGIGSEYKLTQSTGFYCNFTQAYRPVLYSDLTPPATTDSIDVNLHDAKGFNFDIGYRGNLKNYLNFDVNFFHQNYSNRIGLISQLNQHGGTYNLRTNVGSSTCKGIEAYIEFDPVSAFTKKSTVGYVSLFTALSFIDAKYDNYKIKSYNSSSGQLEEQNYRGKKVEYAPEYIHRMGANYSYKFFSITWQISLVGEVYSDANNTEMANSSATVGKISGYNVNDISTSFKIFKKYNIKAGINNISNERYSTRRAGGYPGPGLIPGEARTFYISLGAKF